ncbi:GMC family oxidoreductase [Flavihumibacter sp. R14]|nr:GMC family oxidoreductase [Flavihumibacter soli]
MEVKDEKELIYDVCVVGSGPAGMITALEYAGSSPESSVVIIEYGLPGKQPGTNALDETIRNSNPLNHHDPYDCTNKGLGGTSATWGGRCVMYDEVDFIDRPILEGGCTWDTGLLTEIKNYLPSAAQYFECGDPIFHVNDLPDLQKQPIAENFKSSIVTDTILERYSMPTRFGTRYMDELERLNNVTLLAGYEAREFGSPDDNGTVSILTVRNVQSATILAIRSKTYILAAGTQETTRILLRNKELFRLLDKEPESLGRYYQSHLSGKIASVKFSGDPKRTDYGFISDRDGTYVRRRFQFSTEFLVKQNLLNTAIWLDNPLYYNANHKSGAMSFMYLMMLVPFVGKRLAPPAIAQSITKGKVNDIRKHLWNIIKDLPGSLLTPGLIFYKRYLLKRKLPGVFLYSPQNRYALHFHSEQIPVKENCMVLGRDGETLEIHYKLTEPDIESIIKLHEMLDQELRASDSGKLEYWFEKEHLNQAIREMSRDGIHQSGTTRISGSPDKGVVDKNLKVWGTKNLYVCSSSVFPTSGQANPTFFLGAFAVRLANHINNETSRVN